MYIEKRRFNAPKLWCVAHFVFLKKTLIYLSIQTGSRMSCLNETLIVTDGQKRMQPLHVPKYRIPCSLAPVLCMRVQDLVTYYQIV
jgi:hypothetical protein